MFKIFIISCLLLILNSCVKESEKVIDTIPPENVSDLYAIPHNSSIDLVWKDPQNNDFKNVKISYTPNGDEPIFVSKDQEFFLITLDCHLV